MAKKILGFSIVLLLSSNPVFAEEAATPTMQYQLTTDKPVEAFSEFCAQLVTLFGEAYARTVEVQFTANSFDGSNSTSIIANCPQDAE